MRRRRRARRVPDRAGRTCPGRAADHLPAGRPARRRLGTPGVRPARRAGLYLLAAMDESDLRAAIDRPARLAGLVVEPGLVDLLVSEVADQPGALPLMSHALAETWQRREGRTLTVAGYRASGGIRGAVAQSAEDGLREGASQRAAPLLRDLLLRLVTPGPGGRAGAQPAAAPAGGHRTRRTTTWSTCSSGRGWSPATGTWWSWRTSRWRVPGRGCGSWLARRPRGPADPAPPRRRRRLVELARPPRQRALPRCAARQGARVA